MLEQRYRLKKKYQFNYVYRVGKTCHGRFILLVFSPSKNQNVKIGVSASKKVGNSVQRNRARRIIREAIKPYLDCIKPNFNIILVAKSAIEGKKTSEVQADLQTILEKAELLK